MSEPRPEINFAMLQNYTKAAASQLSSIEERIYRYWAEAIDDAEQMIEIMNRLIAEFRKGV
jgi:hypothetical protein